MERTGQPIKEERGNEEKDLKNENSERKEEEDYTEQTVYKTVINIWTIRCYHCRLNFEFISVLSIYVYTCSYLLYKGDCGMTSLHAVMYMYTINRSYDFLVPVKDATARYCADYLCYSLTFKIRIPIGIDSSALPLFLSYIHKI